MSNIIGNPFQPYVKKQIEIRQNKLGQYSNIDPNTLKWYTTKTPWLRLASSVDIDDNIIKSLGISNNLNGSGLAKNFILFGGASNDKGNLPYGLNFSNTELNGSYGWGGISERGFVPLPGIVSANMSYYNNGALSKANIRIKAYSREQFALIDYLYMRAGYSLLLEFGHTVYIDNNGDLQTWDVFDSTPLQAFLSGQVIGPTATTETTRPAFTNALSEENRDAFSTTTTTPLVLDQYKIQEYINNYKKTKNGNYEGMIGVIHKFNWSFNRDGSYDITVELTGYGSIIESLNINLVNPQDPNPDVDTTEGTEEPLIVTSRNKTKLNEWLYTIYKRLGESFTRRSSAGSRGVKQKGSPVISTEREFRIISTTVSNKIVGTEITDNFTVYTPFSSLLQFIEEQLLVYDKKGEQIIPYIKFDFNYKAYNTPSDPNEKDENYFFSPITQFSANPNICLIPVSDKLYKYVNSKYGSIDGRTIFADSTIKTIKQVIPSEDKYSDFRLNDFTARMGDILLNIDYIASVLDGLSKAESNTAALVSFLETILKDVNTSLGNINNFTIHHDRETNTIKIYDITPQKYDKPAEELTTINIYGVKENDGSFITEIDLNSELSPDFASATSIGAQANNFNNLSQNTFSFSQYNNGLTDRIISLRASKESIDQPQNSTLNAINYTKFLEVARAVFIDKQFTQENIDVLKNYNNQWQTENVFYFAKNKYINAPFFLPFNLKLTMDGLSGVRLFEKFKVSKGVLPKTYDEDKVSLLIKAVSHEVNTKSWTTSIETVSTPEHTETLKSLELTLPSSNQNGTAATAATATSNGICGQKLMLGIIPPTDGDLTKRKQAMDKSFDYTFSNMDPNEEKGMCAQYTYNLAFNYIAYLRSTPNKANLSAGGDANDESYFKNLERLGYIRKAVAKNITKNELRTLINTTPYQSGDVIVYWANGIIRNKKLDSHIAYGHTQIYVGNKSPSKWSSSLKNNYGLAFLYNSRNNECWNFYIFRAPNI
jgi:hypothetical protein